MGTAIRRRFIAVCATAAALWLGAENAHAAHPADVFKGQIITAKKRIPNKAQSQNAYVKEVRRLKASQFWEDKAEKKWKVFFVAFFAHPLNDLEVTVKLYDVTGGKRKMLSSFEQYLDRSGERVVNSEVVLERAKVGVNRELLMTMENRGKVIAQGKFQLLGDGPKYTGEVDFTQDEQ
jgi:hypothetical protein